MKKLLAVLTAVCLLAVILAACSNPESTADSAPATPAAPAVAAAPVVAKAWTEVATWKGSGIKNTETFTVKSGEWCVGWSCNGSAATASILQIYVYDGNGSLVTLVANVLGASTDTSYVRGKPGNYYLEIVSANCNWAVMVQDIR